MLSDPRRPVLFHLVMALLGCGVLASLSYANDARPSTRVGILEDDRTELVNWKSGPSTNRVILPMFESARGEWVLNTNVLEVVTWRIVHGGRDLGSFKSQPSLYPRSLYQKYHIPVAETDLKLLGGDTTRRFSGWLDAEMVQPQILVSNGHGHDPEQWQYHECSTKELAMFRAIFRKEYPSVRNCDQEASPLPDPWKYDDPDIRVGVTYRSRAGAFLVSMRLEGCKCDMTFGPFIDQCFLVSAGQAPKRLDIPGSEDRPGDYGLTFVGAGDFDSDEESEVIFFLSGYAEDGYVLFYDYFTKHVKHTWHYH